MGRRSRSKGRKKRKKRKWIQKAIKHPGALKAWAKRNARKIAAATHSKVFTKDGELNTRTLEKLRHTKMWDRLDTTTKRRINLAITLEKMHKDKGE